MYCNHFRNLESPYCGAQVRPILKRPACLLTGQVSPRGRASITWQGTRYFRIQDEFHWWIWYISSTVSHFQHLHLHQSSTCHPRPRWTATMDFNAPWDEPDNLWSTPTPNSPPRLPSQLHLDTSLDPPEPGPSSPLHQSPTSEFSDTPTISNAFKSAHIPHTYTISHPTPTDSSASSRLPPLSLHLPDDDLQTTGTPALDSSPISPSIVFSSPSSTQSMFSASSVANSPSNLPPDDDDDFGDFDDGDLNQNGQLSADDGFGDFGTFASAPVTPLASPRLVSRPIVPFKLPSSINPDTLRLALAPALEALFDSSTDPSPWLSSNLTPQKPTRNSSQKSISKTHLPPIHYQSEVLRQAWTSLVEDDNGLGVPLDWKRSQIRRQFLVHLGIPVDLNDVCASYFQSFLSPSHVNSAFSDVIILQWMDRPSFSFWRLRHSQDSTSPSKPDQTLQIIYIHMLPLDRVVPQDHNLVDRQASARRPSLIRLNST